LSPTQPAESASYPYPVLMTYARQDPKLVRAMTEAMLATFNEYKSAAPGNVGWALDRQKFGWVIPYHEGAVAVFKEKGVWTAEHESNNNMLIKRQTILADTWKQVQSRKHADDQAFAKDWMESRAAALTKAGMDPVMKSW